MARGTETLLCRYEGRVQGVFFRDWTVKMAGKYRLAGWVRNRADGSVEALFHGRLQDVLDMVEASRKGPKYAEISRVTTDRVQPPNDTTKFKKRLTI